MNTAQSGNINCADQHRPPGGHLSSEGSMKMLGDIDRLRMRRRKLVVAYMAFVATFGSSCAMAASGEVHSTVLTSFGLSALSAVLLYILNVLVHFSARAVNPNANTVGLKHLIASILFLTPIEAALVLPAINLFVSGRILKSYAAGVATQLKTPPSISAYRPSDGPRDSSSGAGLSQAALSSAAFSSAAARTPGDTSTRPSE